MRVAQTPAGGAPTGLEKLQALASNGPVSYGPVQDAEPLFRAQLRTLMEGGAMRFCDVGGGKKPIASLAEIERSGLDYVVFDASQEELDKAPAGYHTFQGSIIDEDAVSRLVRERGPFDVVMSRWTAEHIPDGKRFHEQVFTMLRPGGTAVHFFPTLYSLPFLFNRLLSPQASAALLFRANPWRHTKFLAYYSWCRGPSEKQTRRLEEIGFSVEHYVGFFGHGFYARVKPLDVAHKAVANVLLDHPLPSMTSFAMVVLTRPL
jgi:SAM-dependent methyltransferase